MPLKLIGCAYILGIPLLSIITETIHATIEDLHWDSMGMPTRITTFSLYSQLLPREDASTLDVCILLPPNLQLDFKT